MSLKDAQWNTGAPRDVVFDRGIGVMFLGNVLGAREAK
jgi:hypothetical protein